MRAFSPDGCRRRGARKRAAPICLAIIAAIALGAGPAAARRRQPYYRVQSLHGEVAFDLAHDKDIRTQTGRPDLDQSELLLEQDIRFGGSGWLYHPTLAEIDTDFSLLFNQDFASSVSGNSTESTANQFNYDVHLNLLPYKPYPMTAFVSQLRSQINAPFTPRRIIDTFRYGAGLTLPRLQIGLYEVPTRMSYRHQETETSSFSLGTDSFQSRDEIEFATNNETQNTNSRLRYSWQALANPRGRVANESNRHVLRATRERRLERGDMAGQFFLSGEGGRTSNLGMSFSESMNLRHDHALQSTYGYALTYQNTTRSSQLTHSGRVGVSHQLYQSLASGLSANATYSDSQLGRTYTVGGGGRLAYSKKIPGGKLRLRFNPAYSYTDQRTETGVVSVSNESHDIVVGPPIVLNRTLVIPTSIVVRDPVTLQIFTPVTDYTVVPLGTGGVRTGIQVVPGQALDPAVPPLTSIMEVSYDHMIEPARVFDSLIISAGGGLDLWQHLNVDVAYTKTSQDLIEGIQRQFTLDDSRRIMVRARLDFDRNRTRFEYENFESKITPYERFTLSHNISLSPTPRSTLGMTAGYDHNRITDTGRLTQSFSVTANGTALLPYRILGRLNLLVRWIDQVEQTTLGTSGSVSFNFHYGRVQFGIEDRVGWRKTENKFGRDQSIRQLVNTLFFRISRTF